LALSTNDIKKKIAATENMSKITRAMQMVSVSKLAKTESRVKHFREYHAEIKSILSTLRNSEYVNGHPFSKGSGDRGNRKIGCVIVTSNRGLVGGYNNSLFKMLKDGGSFNRELFKIDGEQVTSDADFKFYVAGQKGAVFARSELPDDSTETFLFPDEIQYADIIGLASKLITDYINGEVNEVVILYQNFISKLTQEAIKKVLLPLEFEKVTGERVPNYEIKPTEKDVCESLLIQYVITSLYEIFLSANQSEHAARMNAMSNATDNAEDIIKESKLIYNRARQAAITQELNEIVAGANAVN